MSLPAEFACAEQGFLAAIADLPDPENALQLAANWRNDRHGARHYGNISETTLP
jgi:hypothetical protein